MEKQNLAIGVYGAIKLRIGQNGATVHQRNTSIEGIGPRKHRSIEHIGCMSDGLQYGPERVLDTERV
jgi:hypothetical protein